MYIINVLISLLFIKTIQNIVNIITSYLLDNPIIYYHSIIYYLYIIFDNILSELSNKYTLKSKIKIFNKLCLEKL